VIEQAVAEHDVEGAVRGEVPGVVLDERQVRQLDARLRVAAGLEVRFAHLQPEHLEAHAREFDREAALEAAEIRDSQRGLVAWKSCEQQLARRDEHRMRLHRHGAGLRLRAVVQADVVHGEFGSVRGGHEMRNPARWDRAKVARIDAAHSALQ